MSDILFQQLSTYPPADAVEQENMLAEIFQHHVLTTGGLLRQRLKSMGDCLKLFICSALTVVALLLSGCGYQGGSGPIRYAAQPCVNESTTDPVAHSYAALLLALAERGWRMQGISHKTQTVIASACGGRESICATLKFSIESNGRLVMEEMPSTPVNRYAKDDVHRWIMYLRPVFQKFSCQTDDALRIKVKEYGFTF